MWKQRVTGYLRRIQPGRSRIGSAEDFLGLSLMPQQYFMEKVVTARNHTNE